MINNMIQKTRYYFLKIVAGLKLLQKPQKTAFCLLLFTIYSAQASFISQCSIDATVLEDTSGIRAYLNDENGHEYEKQSITVKVQIEKLSSSTEVACQDIKIGEQLTVSIDRVNWSTLHKGQKITFSRLYKTDANRIEPFIIYQVF